jgi:hypothetical protein
MSTTEWFVPPRSQDLALALEMGEAEGRLPRHPCACIGRKALPIIHFARKMLSCKDRSGGHHDKFDVGDGHARPLHLFLCILQHDDVLGNAIRLHVVLVHVGAEGDHVDGVEPPTVGIKERDDFKSHHLHIEGVGILEVVVPDLVDNFAEELGGTTFGRLKTGIAVERGFVGHLRTNANNRGGVIRNVAVIEREADGASECVAAMVCSVPHTIRDDGSEGVDAPQLIIGDLHEDWEERLPDRQEIVIHGLSLKGGEGIAGLFKEESDRNGHHSCLGGFCGGQASAVKDRDDDDQRESVSSGELGDFCAFQDAAESISRGDSNSGLCSFFCVKLKLGFHCRGQWGGDGFISIN